MWWIRAAIQEYILHSWSLVKMGTTAAQKKLFFNLRKLKGRMEELEQGDLPPETVTAIATELDVPGNGGYRDEPPPGRSGQFAQRDDGRGCRREWLEMLPDERPSQESLIGDGEEMRQRRALLGAALSKLNQRERDILVERRLKDEPATLEELSHRYAVSRERIRQIEVRAFQKLQERCLRPPPFRVPTSS